jgi:leader peptidase (prepilin peptidase)/N-methyltransferase
MDVLIALAAAAVGFVAGWLAGARQHLIYRQQEYRDTPATGAAAWLIRGGVGLATAAVVGLAFRPDHYDFGPALLTAVLGFLLVLVASTDFERRVIPNRVSYPGILLAAAFCWAWPDRSVAGVFLGGGVALGAAVALFVLGEVVRAALRVRATAFGLGDVKLLLWMGLVVGWPAIMSAAFVGILAAGLVSFLYLFQRQWRKTFSYGPYLVAGALAAMLWMDRFN